MKLTNNVVHAVVGETFVIGLHDLDDDDTTLQFMVTKDKKEICYLNHLSDSMKDHGCESYNVLVDLPEVKKNPVNPDRTSHSKRDWNKLQAVLNRSTFDSTVKMLELNTDNKITFVVEVLKADVIKPLFEDKDSTVVFQAALNELDLIKFKIPFKEELKCIFEGNMDMYSNRIDERLSCKVCNFYISPDDQGLPISRPFKCTHFYHPQCVTAWKFFGLDQTNKEKKFVSNECFVCKSGLCDLYKDLYDHDWNIDGTVTRSKVNARTVSVDITYPFAQIQVRPPTQVRAPTTSTRLNLMDQQQSDIEHYEERNVDYRNNQLLFHQFMLQDKHHSSPQSSRQRSTRPRNSPNRLMDQQSHALKSRSKVKPSALVTCINDSSISVMTTETSVRKSKIKQTKPSTVIMKKRRKAVLTNSSTKKKETNNK